MGHQTTDTYRRFGNKIALYVQRASLELIPQLLPMAVLHAQTEEYNFFLLSMRCCFPFNLGSNKGHRYFTVLVKAVSSPSSLSGSIGSGLYFLVKIIYIDLWINHQTLGHQPSVCHLQGVFHQVLRVVRYHMHSCRHENLLFVNPLIGHLLRGTTVVGVKPLPVDSLSMVCLQ